MKYKSYIVGVIFGVLFLITSCVHDDVPTEPGEPGRLVEMSLSAAGMGSSSLNDVPDYEIKSIRILAFASNSRLLKFNSGMIDLSSRPLPVTFEIMTGTYEFVFIANEHSEAGDILSGTLDGWLPGVSRSISIIDGAAFHYNAFSKDKCLPATSVYRNVTVLGDNELTYYDEASTSWVNVSNDTNPLWSVEVERLAVRLDLELVIDEYFSDQITGIKIANVPDKVPFLHTGITDGLVRYYEEGYDETYPLTDISINDFEKTGPGDDGKYTYKLERIILPASVFSEIANQSKALTIEVHVSSNPGKPLKGAIGLSVPTNFTSPRNIYYKVTGNVSNNSLLLNVVADAWDEIVVPGNGGEQKLNVERLSATISEDEAARIHFWSNQPSVSVDETGYINLTGDTGFTVNDFLKNLSGSNATSVQYDASTGLGFIDIELYNTDIPVNTFRIYLNAGGLRREIIVYIKR